MNKGRNCEQKWIEVNEKRTEDLLNENGIKEIKESTLRKAGTVG